MSLTHLGHADTAPSASVVWANLGNFSLDYVTANIAGLIRGLEAAAKAIEKSATAPVKPRYDA